MFNFHEDDSEVVNEQHRVNHAVGIRDQIVVLDSSSLFVENADSVKKPKGENKNEQKCTDASSEEINPRHCGFRRTEEKSPGAK